VQKKSKIVGPVLILILMIVVPAAGSFSYDFYSGEEIRYRNVFKMSSSMETNNLIVDSELELFGILTQVIRDSSDGEFIFDIIFESLETRDFSRSMGTKNSSRTPMDHRDELQESLDQILGEQLLTFLIDEKGNLMDREVNAALENFPHVNLASLGQQVFISFPNKEMDISSTWVSQKDFTLPQGGNIRSISTDVHYMVIDKVEIDGIECYKIEAEIDYSGSTSLDSENGKRVEVRHVGLGFLYYSPDLNRLVRGLTSQEYSVRVYTGREGEEPRIENNLQIKMDNIITMIND